MKVESRRRLGRDIGALRSLDIKLAALDFIEDAKHSTLAQLLHSYDFQPLKTDSSFYRLRIDDYRLGCRYDRGSDTLLLMRLLPRGIMYDHFP